MIECNDDEFTFTEDSFIGAFFDDQFTNVEDELALLAMESYDNDSTTGKLHRMLLRTFIVSNLNCFLQLACFPRIHNLHKFFRRSDCG